MQFTKASILQELIYVREKGYVFGQMDRSTKAIGNLINETGRHRIYSNQDYYRGDYVDNKIHGQGTYMKADGSFYAGEWVFGKPHG